MSTAQPRTRRDCTCPRFRHEHGTRGAHELDGCRCYLCRVAYAASRSARRRGESSGEVQWVPAAGVQRRLRALFALGWNWSVLATHLGVNLEAARQLAVRQCERCHPSTAARVAAVYEALCMTRPDGAHAQRARTRAARHGWLPPLAWDDDTIDDPAAVPNLGPHAHRYGPGRPTETVPDVIDDIAVDEAIHGRPVPLTPAETAVVVKRLTDRGWSAAQIAQRIGTTTRTVTRKRAAA
jgi:hypothetical protein